MQSNYLVACKCLSCNSTNLITGIKIVNLPIADKLLTNPEETNEELPLTLLMCANCNLVFIKELVTPEILFPQNYPYFTGISSVLTKHFKDLAASIITKYKLNSSSLVIDIGSNDGTALKFFLDTGIKVLGIDPTTRPALKAILNNIPTLRAFWNNETSAIVAQELNRKADVVLCNNVISHVFNPAEFIGALENICSSETNIIAEFPYLKSIIEKTAFDIIFHQHVSYFTIATFEQLIRPYGFYINDAEVLAVHGGNLRVYFSKQAKQSVRLEELKNKEIEANLCDTNLLHKFSEKINTLKKSTLKMLDSLNEKGVKIMGYGAAGKATMLVKHFELNQQRLSGIIDKNEFKQNKYFPAYKHKIYSPDVLRDANNKPDYLLILAWTLKDEIIAELSEFKKGGGKFIVVLPEWEII